MRRTLHPRTSITRILHHQRTRGTLTLVRIMVLYGNKAADTEETTQKKPDDRPVVQTLHLWKKLPKRRPYFRRQSVVRPRSCRPNSSITPTSSHLLYLAPSFRLCHSSPKSSMALSTECCLGSSLVSFRRCRGHASPIKLTAAFSKHGS